MFRMSSENELSTSFNEYVAHLTEISQPLTQLLGATATATGADGQPTAGTYPPGASSAPAGPKLSVGAAAGIGVGGALLLVAVLALVIFLLRRARRRKQNLDLPPHNVGPSTHHSSLGPTSPPSQFSSPYEQPQELKMNYGDPPPMTLVPNYGHPRILSHELDSSILAGSPQMSAYQSQSQSMTPKRSPSPTATGIIAPQPRSPPPTLTSSGFQYHQPSQGHVSPPTGGQRTPGSNHETSSYGFPSHEGSPNPDFEGFKFQQGQQPDAGSPESQQRLFPRRVVGSPNLRGSRSG
jgi:hypothetical protein